MPSLHLLFKGGKESCGGGGKEGAHVTRIRWYTSASPPQPHPQVLLVSGSPSVTPHWSDSHYSLFPDLVGCISLCKHSPLGLWNPKQHLYLHRKGDKNSQENSPQVLLSVFGYAKQGRDGADLECEVVSKLWGVRSGCG